LTRCSLRLILESERLEEERRWLDFVDSAVAAALVRVAVPALMPGWQALALVAHGPGWPVVAAPVAQGDWPAAAVLVALAPGWPAAVRVAHAPVVHAVHALAVHAPACADRPAHVTT
jgi:hypothetical protein